MKPTMFHLIEEKDHADNLNSVTQLVKNTIFKKQVSAIICHDSTEELYDKIKATSSNLSQLINDEEIYILRYRRNLSKYFYFLHDYSQILTEIRNQTRPELENIFFLDINRLLRSEDLAKTKSCLKRLKESSENNDLTVFAQYINDGSVNHYNLQTIQNSLYKS